MKRLAFIFIFFSLGGHVTGQKLFSEEKPIFYNQAVSAIESIGTEAANKVSFDFRNAWNAKFTSDQQDKIQEIATKMQLKGYGLTPYQWWFFSYVSYSVSQADLNQDQISNVLDINLQVLETMTKGEYRNFLLGLNTFMARRILSATKNVRITTDDGDFSFSILGYAGPAQEEDYQETEEEPEPEVVQEPEPEVVDTSSDSGDDWGSNDDWGSTDDWGSNDDWGSTDDWGSSSDDDWGSTDDSWGSDTSNDWDSNDSYEEPAPVREVISAVREDFVKGKQNLYTPPIVQGSVIKLVNNNAIIATPYDSLRFKNIDAFFLLGTRQLVGTKATIDWPGHHYNNEGASITLTDFFLKGDRADFWTPYAKLSFPGLISGQVEGVFEFKSQRRKVKIGRYPIFTSNKADIKMDLGGGKVNYTGGIKLLGNILYGTSISREDGRLQILDGKGNSIIMKGQTFLFKDSVISSENVKFLMKHGEDSITHQSVSFRYDRGSKQLILRRNKDFNTEPFNSSYFSVDINAQMINWDLSTDSLNFNIQDGKNLVPLVIRSKDYFNLARFKKMSGGFPFHPIVTSVYYANKYGIKEFNDEELRAEFDVDIKLVKAAMKMLSQYGFAKYNQASGEVTLTDKIFHYYNSAAGKKDYDNLLISSVEPKLPNATFRLDSGQLVVRGIENMFLTMDFDVEVTPDTAQVILLKNRDFLYDGKIKAGDFIYTGHNFKFSYDEFKVDMPVIDSIRIQLHQDSLGNDSEVKNQLTGTSGALYLDYPDDKSGKIITEHYPYFISNSESVVYFNKPEILGGAYDKSVFFVVPPFEEDSLDLDSAINFVGQFNSGGIFPTFDEVLEIQEDKSLGFIHDIPEEGYHLYGTSAKTYEKISLSNDGIRGGGKIDFLTSSLYSPDFVYYPDSVAAFGTNGFIGAGNLNGASYPEAVLGPYRMKWKPRKDSMYLENLYEPFKFYNATAELNGVANITTNGVYGSGTMFTRGSKAISDELNFKQFEYSARHAEFEVLTDDPEKPAMAGDDISLIFDLTRNVADISPEKQGVAAISFPYAKIKTSITKAVWDLDDSVVTMTKPANVPIEKSYFYSTLPTLKGLTINAEKADYDFNTRELNIQKIPYIKVADALIIPENNETTILENSVLQPFNNAEIIMDTINRHHYLYDGNIQIKSSEEFVGTAMYRLITQEDTFAIKFDSFVLLEEYITPDKKKLMTVSGGEVLAKQNLTIAPGFFYKGRVKMFAAKKALELNGAVKLDLQDPSYNSWILFDRKPDQTDVSFDFETAFFEDETSLEGGLLYDIRGSVYTSVMAHARRESDESFFRPKGTLFYDSEKGNYVVEAKAKTLGESYEGHTFIYNDSSKSVVFEGNVNYFNPFSDNVQLKAAVLGVGNSAKDEYTADSFIGVNFKNSITMMEIMSKDLTDIVERLGPPVANDISLEMLYKLANYTSDKIAKDYEKSFLKSYKPLHEFEESLEKSILISGVKMKWSQAHNAWYNYTKIGISNILDNDVNAKMDGFLEIKKDATGQDVINLFIQAAPGTWYYFSYHENNLLMYSSNSDFNTEVNAQSNQSNAKPGELVLIGGDENETLSFINAFREDYFGVTEPYNLVFPDEVQLEDEENFDTIEKDDEDDGFGF